MDNSDSILNDVSITRKVTDVKHIQPKWHRIQGRRILEFWGRILKIGGKKIQGEKNFHEKRHSGGIM